LSRRTRRPHRSRSSLGPLFALLVIVAALSYWWATRPPGARHQERASHARPPLAAGSAVASSPAARAPADFAAPAAVRSSSAPATAIPRGSNDGAGPRLALIIDDCGQWPQTERGFIALDVPLTLSVLPHVRYGAEIARDAHAAGKGVMLHLPMEPQSGIDPGPGRITTAMDDDEIASQLRADLAAVPLATGVNNHEGSRATADDRVMREVVAVLAPRGLFFIDSRTAPNTVAARDAAAAGVPTASRDVFLDNVADVASTEEQLRRAAALARENGFAIAIGHPRPTTLAAVRALVPELRSDGIAFVLAADLVR